ncbi:MAG: T9SS type A sorting domain-containing protein, partial [Bacteroidota bacterium]
IYAAMLGAGVFKSEDEGNTWIACYKGLESVSTTCIIEHNGIFYAGTHGKGVYQSSDEGLSWLPTNQSESPVNHYVTDIEKLGDLLIIGTLGGIYYSENEGDSWEKVQLPIPKGAHHGIYTLEIVENEIVAGSDRYAFISTNGGTEWYQTKISEIYDVVSSIYYQDKIYFGTSGSGVKVAEKVDGYWDVPEEESETSGRNVRAITLADTSLVLAIAAQGILLDEQDLNFGLLDIRARSLLAHKGKLYAGTVAKGILKLDIAVPEALAISPISSSNTAIYPNPASVDAIQINYEVLESGNVELQLYNQQGVLIDRIVPAQINDVGRHSIDYNTANLKEGAYYILFNLSGAITTKTFLIIR